MMGEIVGHIALLNHI